MGVYEPLQRYLELLDEDSWSASFQDIEKILDRPLPPSAREYRPWWGNQKKGGHSQAKAWRDAGWETGTVDLKHKTVRFERVDSRRASDPRSKPGDDHLDNLLSRASSITGISDRDELVRVALEFLIRHEAGKALIAVGGSDPTATAPPRRRFR